MKVLGVDPGKKGAAALVTGGGGFRRAIEIWDLPFDDDGVLDYDAMHKLMKLMGPDFAYIENVWPRSRRAPGAKDGMGFITSNKFMKSVGALEGIIAGYVPRENRHKVVPTVWKKDFGLIGKDKTASRETFSMLWPGYGGLVTRVKDDGRAEAGLIATRGAIRQGMMRMVQG